MLMKEGGLIGAHDGQWDEFSTRDLGKNGFELLTVSSYRRRMCSL